MIRHFRHKGLERLFETGQPAGVQAIHAARLRYILALSMYNPPHPGGIIREMCLNPLGWTITKAAQALGVTRKMLSDLINERTRITPEMALRLSEAFGRSPESWLQLQDQYDLWQARSRVDLEHIRHIRRQIDQRTDS
jgi:addiction module HigA family antidote